MFSGCSSSLLPLATLHPRHRSSPSSPAAPVTGDDLRVVIQLDAVDDNDDAVSYAYQWFQGATERVELVDDMVLASAGDVDGDGLA